MARTIPETPPPSPECDFCMAKARPVAMFRNTAYYAIGAGPARENLYNPPGAWGACERCASWVELRSVTGLLNYVMLEEITRTGKGFNIRSARQLTKLWTELFKHLGAREEFIPSKPHAVGATDPESN